MNRVLLEEGRYALERLCRETPASNEHALLLQSLAELWPRWSFRHVLSRGGWYRPGRIFDAQGEPLVQAGPNGHEGAIEPWIEQAWADCGEDMGAFCERYLDQGLYLSRHEGQTHFFVAPYGKKGEQFIQLEIETLREVRDRPLLDAQQLPTEFEELLDPPQLGGAQDHHAVRTPLGEARYSFRRVTDMAEFLARLRGQRPDAPPACRFVEEWNQSSSASKALCEHWVFALAEHLDRFRQPVLSAHPLSLDGGGALLVPDDPLGRAAAIQTFDRQRGYPAAWYFHMTARAGVPTEMAMRMGEDMAHGLDYLPERDAALLARWLDRPYSV